MAQYTAASSQSVVDAAAGGGLEVVVASYDMLRRHGDHLAAAGFHAAIFDEVHRLKNARSSTYQAAAALPTHLRYGLTGTPMQNAYAELWCLMDFISPGCLGPSKEFNNFYAAAIKAGQRLGASSWEVTQVREEGAAAWWQCSGACNHTAGAICMVCELSLYRRPCCPTPAAVPAIFPPPHPPRSAARARSATVAWWGCCAPSCCAATSASSRTSCHARVMPSCSAAWRPPRWRPTAPCWPCRTWPTWRHVRGPAPAGLGTVALTAAWVTLTSEPLPRLLVWCGVGAQSRGARGGAGCCQVVCSSSS